MSNTEDLDELIKISQLNIDVLNSDILGNIEKYRTIVRFNKAKKNHPEQSQPELCKSIGISVSTLERIRKDLNVQSPYRYTVSVKTEAQKEKDRYKQKVYTAFKSGLIDEDTKVSYYDKIKSNFDKSIKDEIKNLRGSTESIKSTVKSNSDHEIKSNRMHTRKNYVRGGTITDDEASDKAREIASKINL